MKLQQLQHSKKEFLEAIRMILDSMFFSFDDQFYKQKFEFSMRFSLSLVATDLVMQYARVGDSIVEYKFQDTTFIIRR